MVYGAFFDTRAIFTNINRVMLILFKLTGKAGKYMELKWLEDYLALAKYSNFSEAAKSRHLTQPAFSRRIRLLESWLDVELVNRGVNPVQLTPAGIKYLSKAEKIIDQIYDSRDQLQKFTQGRDTITVHTQHSLMVSYVPSLLENIQSSLADIFVRFNANDQQDSVQRFMNQEGDLLLCFSALSLPQRLAWNHIEKCCISHDRLLPVTATDDKGKPRYRIQPNQALRVLAYPRESFFQRLIEQNNLSQLNTLQHAEKVTIQVVFENALAAGLKLMVLKGYGVAWLPESSIEKELRNKELVILSHKLFQPIPLDINLYRHKSSTQAVGQKFWAACANNYSRVI